MKPFPEKLEGADSSGNICPKTDGNPVWTQQEEDDGVPVDVTQFVTKSSITVTSAVGGPERFLLHFFPR